MKKMYICSNCNQYHSDTRSSKMNQSNTTLRFSDLIRNSKVICEPKVNPKTVIESLKITMPKIDPQNMTISSQNHLMHSWGKNKSIKQKAIEQSRKKSKTTQATTAKRSSQSIKKMDKKIAETPTKQNQPIRSISKTSKHNLTTYGSNHKVRNSSIRNYKDYKTMDKSPISPFQSSSYQMSNHVYLDLSKHSMNMKSDNSVQICEEDHDFQSGQISRKYKQALIERLYESKLVQSAMQGPNSKLDYASQMNNLRSILKKNAKIKDGRESVKKLQQNMDIHVIKINGKHFIQNQYCDKNKRYTSNSCLGLDLCGEQGDLIELPEMYL